MAEYWIHSEPNAAGEYEVHNIECTCLPEINKRYSVGRVHHCNEAIVKAKEKYAALADLITACKKCCDCDNCTIPCVVKGTDKLTKPKTNARS